MMGLTELIVIGGGILLVAAIGFLSFYLGDERRRRKQSDQIAKERNRDSQIAVEPFIPGPFGGMRPKDHLSALSDPKSSRKDSTG
jgi:hypothetical protein